MIIRVNKKNRLRCFWKKTIQKIHSFWVRKQCVSCGADLKVNFKSSVNRNTTLGNNVNFNGMKIVGCGKVTIGDNFHSGNQCCMITEIHNYEGSKIPYDDELIPKDIVIKDNVWFGNQVLVLGGITIGEGAIIQAGSVVSSDIPDYSIAGGNPARVFKMRNVEHYLKLKESKCFQ